MARHAHVGEPDGVGAAARWRLMGRFVLGGMTPALLGRLALAALGGGAAAAVLATLLGRA